MTKLIDLIKENKISEALQLLDSPNHGIDLDAKDEGWGATALNYAAANGAVQIVEKLLALGADKECRDNHGQTPLHDAAYHNHVQIVEKLLYQGAYKERKNIDDETPLHHAAFCGHAQVVEKLIKHGANKECKDELDQTPLHLAAENGHVQVVKILVAAGTNITSKNRRHLSALDIARQHQHHAVVAILEEAEKKKQAIHAQNLTRLKLVIAGIIGVLSIGGLVIGIGALAGWGIMVSLLSFAPWLAIAIPAAIVGIALLGTLAYGIKRLIANKQEQLTKLDSLSHSDKQPPLGDSADKDNTVSHALCVASSFGKPLASSTSSAANPSTGAPSNQPKG